MFLEICSNLFSWCGKRLCVRQDCKYARQAKATQCMVCRTRAGFAVLRSCTSRTSNMSATTKTIDARIGYFLNTDFLPHPMQMAFFLTVVTGLLITYYLQHKMTKLQKSISKLNPWVRRSRLSQVGLNITVIWTRITELLRYFPLEGTAQLITILQD